MGKFRKQGLFQRKRERELAAERIQLCAGAEQTASKVTATSFWVPLAESSSGLQA